MRHSSQSFRMEHAADTLARAISARLSDRMLGARVCLASGSPPAPLRLRLAGCANAVSSSPCDGAAVDRDNRSGHELRGIGGEQHGYAFQIVRPARRSERNLTVDVFLVLLVELLVERRHE